MPATGRIAERAVAVGLGSAVAFNEPLIAMAEGAVAGMPGLYLYIFGVWGLAILLLGLAMRRERIGGG
ncbi:MAG: hypothetical protein EA355_11115 [Rhodobacteraceae bacterium]|nr:MAG: hypothetical protein EA355_11115 [Paracoccaceae bacterium]